MSRWLADSLRIACAPGEVALRRTRGTPASRTLTTDDRNAASLLPLLEEALADSNWHARRVEVVISQRLVRHVLTPAPGKTLSRAEERALVIGSLRNIYGDEALQWQVQIMSQPPQHGLIGAAMDATFIEQLGELLKRHGFQNIAIRPLASVAAHHLPRQYSGWWVLAEPGWVSVLGGTTHHWQHVAAMPADTDWLAGLPDLIKRETEMTTASLPAAVWIQPVGLGAVSAPIATSTRWQVLPHNSQASGALAMLEL